MKDEIRKLIDEVVEATDALSEEAVEYMLDRLLDKAHPEPLEYYVITSESEGNEFYFRYTCSHVPGHKGEKTPVFSEELSDAFEFDTEQDAQECIDWINKDYPEIKLHIMKISEEEDKDGFDFSLVIPLLKQGKKLRRKGWNGKDQYIQLSTHSTYQDYDGPHKLAGKVIVFHGTLGVQVGWLASQGDLLAEDWVIIR